MYELPLSNRYRLRQAIKRLSGLVAYYPLSEVEGTTARNYAPANIGSLNGTITGATVGQTGQVGKAYTFDGINDRVLIARNTIPAFSGKSTIGFIAKALSQVASDEPIMDCQWGDDGAGGWQIILNNGNIIHCYVGDKTGRDDLQPTSGVFDLTDDYHFIIVTKNTTTGQQRLYIDGTLNNTNSSLANGTTEPDTDKDLFFGANSPLDVFSHVSLQHVFFGSVDLTAAQVLKLAKIGGFA